MAAAPDRKPMVEAVGIVNRFGAQVVHDHLDMTIVENEVFGIVGGSGTGKSVLLRTILGLQRPQEGVIRLEGRDITKMSEDELRAVKARYGVTFQQGALFSSLTVLQNVQLPMIEHLDLSALYIRRQVRRVGERCDHDDVVALHPRVVSH